MSTPTNIRSTAGFRSIRFYETNAAGYPIGLKTLEPCIPYVAASGSSLSGSTASVAAGVTVSGSVPYYGIWGSGAKLLTITDPTARVIPHVGDDGVFSLQVLPPTEPITGELTTDKTNDPLDAIAGAQLLYTVGEMNLFGMGTNKRGFENQLCALAYAAAQDTDPNSASFGQTLWDSRIFPKTITFARDTGYRQEANERMYTFTPNYVTAYPWQVQFTNAVEGFTRAQAIRGVSQYKPIIVTWLGDGATLGFPFDSNYTAQAAAKITVWKNNTLQTTGVAKSVYGVGFGVAPSANDVITALYEYV